MNIITINGDKLIKYYKSGRCMFYLFASGKTYSATELKKLKVSVECVECEKNNIIFYRKAILNKKYKCQTCLNKGKNNHFYGKKHSQELKDRFSLERKGKRLNLESKSLLEWWKIKYPDTYKERFQQHKEKISKLMSGKNNPFYGKKHSQKTIKKIQETRVKNFDRLSIEEKTAHKKTLSDKAKINQKKLKEKDYQTYVSYRKKASQCSIRSRKRFVKNKIEIIVENELRKRGLNFRYSVILGHKQFDFGNKKHKILLEVQGDYWHGNPHKYTYTELNHIQLSNIAKDKVKADFAKKHNMKLFYIWENNIKNNDFSILDTIKDIINGN